MIVDVDQKHSLVQEEIFGPVLVAIPFDDEADALRMANDSPYGLGAFTPEMVEIGKNTLWDSDIYVDDPVGARQEAGDLIQAGIDWDKVRTLAIRIDETPDFSRPIVFKSVGTGAWDLAACRVARKALDL